MLFLVPPDLKRGSLAGIHTLGGNAHRMDGGVMEGYCVVFWQEESSAKPQAATANPQAPASNTHNGNAEQQEHL